MAETSRTVGLAALRARLAVLTPENVEFEFEPAGVAERAMAWAIDAAISFGALLLCAIVVVPFGLVSPGLASAIFIVAVFALQWWYGALFEHFWGGRTPGKSLLRLRVIDARGLRITFAQAVVRNLLRVVDILPGFYLVGAIAALVDPSMRRLGDMAAGTVVIRERRVPAPTEVVPASARYNTFLDDPRVRTAARRVTPPERDVMIALGLRRDRLPVPVRHALFAALSAHLEGRLGIPRPPHFSEEKYVLHLTAVVLAGARY
jgi:uncharacterized RDD family membrane protein YckC